MYQDFFHFRELPFSITPNTRFLYLSERHQEALKYLESGLGHGGGFVLLTGEVGTGKTIVSKTLFSMLDENTRCALILNPTFGVTELLAAICDAFTISYSEETSLKEFTDLIVSFLKEMNQQGCQTVVAIDEAQHLGPDVLELLRLLTNFETENEKLLKVLLIGQPELQQKLQQKNLRQLAQRITARYHLLPLTSEHIQRYISHRVEVAGGNIEIFSPAAIKRITQYSNGIPRLINLLCDKALWVSYQEQKAIVDAASVKKACELVLEWQIPLQQKEFKEEEIKEVAEPQITFWKKGSVILFLSLFFTFGLYNLLPNYLNIVSPIPASIVEKPLVGFDTDQSAFQKLLSIWGYFEPLSLSDCTTVERGNLYCIDNNGNLDDLLAINRPALVWLQEANGDELLSIIYHVNSEGIELLLPKQRILVSRQWFEERWNGSYVQLWRKGIVTERPMRKGDKGEAVRQLNQLLATALESPTLDSDSFTKETEENVKYLQRMFGLKPDGVVGDTTLMWLDSLVNRYAPVLKGDK